LHIFHTFDTAAPGGGATSFKELHRPALGALSLGPLCTFVSQSRTTL